ncbi:MAG: hypothetical protein QOJ83_603 [Frankiales bacterium]|jgi:hypothetical protein|nr:hypothetical protein [Frankiales bacterium]
MTPRRQSSAAINVRRSAPKTRPDTACGLYLNDPTAWT